MGYCASNLSSRRRYNAGIKVNRPDCAIAQISYVECPIDNLQPPGTEEAGSKTISIIKATGIRFTSKGGNTSRALAGVNERNPVVTRVSHIHKGGILRVLHYF